MMGAVVVQPQGVEAHPLADESFSCWHRENDQHENRRHDRSPGPYQGISKDSYSHFSRYCVATQFDRTDSLRFPRMNFGLGRPNHDQDDEDHRINYDVQTEINKAVHRDAENA